MLLSRPITMHGLIIHGKTVDTKDPEALGRVKVQLLGYGDDAQVWLRMLMPYASNTAGYVFLPEVDDEVLILRGNGDDVDAMVILGAAYNVTNKPLYSNADGDNITKTIQTRSGTFVTWSDKDGEVSLTLKTAGGNEIAMLDKSDTVGFTVKNGDGTIDLAMTKEGLTLTVGNGKPMSVTVGGDTTINTTGATTIKGTGDVTVESSANLICKGGINATLEAGAQLNVKGGAQVKVEAPMIELAGSMVKIN